MAEEILPLGSVVTLRNGDGTELVIIARASIVVENDEEIYYDYGAVLIPQGMMTPDNVFFFNRENVQEIKFRGYENNDEKLFSKQYNQMIEHSHTPKELFSLQVVSHKIGNAKFLGKAVKVLDKVGTVMTFAQVGFEGISGGIEEYTESKDVGKALGFG
ncbi:DUF4176 domain-containing protein [Streptococcus suis]|uniref:DUF4176 domain-containing protein n=1 Tax=Streptococcus suis TaxID=1307 RepID=UPI001EDCC35E|nr:DUF4176 domain-containing protein [Streptococcus suis]